MAGLALAAMLLLALLPSLGRFVQSASPRQHDTAFLLASMCLPSLGASSPALLKDSVVLKEAALRWQTLVFVDRTSPRDAPSQGHDTLDCAYCPLLTAVALLVLGLIWAGQDWRYRFIAWTLSRADVSAFYPCGLGSRGPPFAL
jgi:hypothetical protein